MDVETGLSGPVKGNGRQSADIHNAGLLDGEIPLPQPLAVDASIQHCQGTCGVEHDRLRSIFKTKLSQKDLIESSV